MSASPPSKGRLKSPISADEFRPSPTFAHPHKGSVSAADFGHDFCEIADETPSAGGFGLLPRHCLGVLAHQLRPVSGPFWDLVRKKGRRLPREDGHRPSGDDPEIAESFRRCRRVTARERSMAEAVEASGRRVGPKWGQSTSEDGQFPKGACGRKPRRVDLA